MRLWTRVLSLMTILLAFVVCALAYANGSNDVSKGVSTLVGSGLATYRRGLMWGTVWTAAGALVAAVVSAGLVNAFSTGLLTSAPADPNRFFLAVAVGAFGWVILASRTGLPVSTTHAIAGAILGAAIAGGGRAAVAWSPLATTVALPLALSPIVAGVCAYLLAAIGARPLTRASRYCVCLGESAGLSQIRVTGDGSAALVSGQPSPVRVDETSRCGAEAIGSQMSVTDVAHWATSAALSFARGMNDNPKIVALGISAAAATGLSLAGLFLAGGAAMSLGSYMYGRRVTNTLAEKVTEIDRLEGLSASAIASALVVLASFAALPVSTTHVSTGAIVGAGLRDGVTAIRWRMMANLVFAWLVTLPVAALFAVVAWVTLEWL